MNNILFIIKGLVKFKLAKKGKAIALVLNEFEDTSIARKALQQYNMLKDEGKTVYILSAFNHASLGCEAKDYRDVYIFNNDPQILAEFCSNKKVSVLYYYDSHVMQNAAAKFGLKTIQM